MKTRISVLLAAFVILLVISAPVLADSGHGNSPQSGYAIVTPTSTNVTGLVVFETFGQSEGVNEFSQAGVLPANMTTSSLLFVDVNPGLQRNLGVAIANPGATDVTVMLNLNRQDGTTSATNNLVVPAGHQVAEFVTDLFPSDPDLASGFVGTLQITSPDPVAVVGLRFRGKNFSTIPATDLSAPTAVPQVTSSIGGPNAVILPQFATGGGWASEIIIENSGTSDLTVRVDLFNQTGGALVANLNNQSASSFTNITIPPNGVVVLAPLDQEGQDEF